MLLSEHGSQGQGPPDGEESSLDVTRDANPDDLSSGNKKPSPSTSPTTSPETSDDEVEQFHKDLYHLCMNKARDLHLRFGAFNFSILICRTRNGP